jgi:aromatic-L-amino-acid/L-tryptophan decarboxylase
MTPEEFRTYGHELVDWMADYMAGVEQYPVKPEIQPRAIIEQLPLLPPEMPESFPHIFNDFRSIILPGMTHWQHPSFFAYFPANSSPPSVLGEMLTATLGAQCMSWATSPAATELEQRAMEWLRSMIGLPETFTGVIQDTASTATLCAILTAREQRSGFGINERGFSDALRYTVYCSAEAHSSVEKAVKIAGIGRENLRKIRVDGAYAMDASALEAAVAADIRQGLTPLCVVAAIGTTGSTALDPVRAIAGVCERHGIWLHCDAAFAGNALILPEFRWIADGIELADSVVFNPHKWMLTNFDCSAYFVRDAGALVRTFEILPEYLKTPESDRVNNYRDWGIQLGRRFRALKLWFVIRSYGVTGLQAILRNHIGMAQKLAATLRATPGFELLAPVPLNVLCFRYAPPSVKDPEELNALNIRFHTLLNADGRMFLTHTKLSGMYALRLVIGQTGVAQHHVDAAWERIVSTARALM